VRSAAELTPSAQTEPTPGGVSHRGFFVGSAWPRLAYDVRGTTVSAWHVAASRVGRTRYDGSRVESTVVGLCALDTPGFAALTPGLEVVDGGIIGLGTPRGSLRSRPDSRSWMVGSSGWGHPGVRCAHARVTRCRPRASAARRPRVGSAAKPEVADRRTAEIVGDKEEWGNGGCRLDEARSRGADSKSWSPGSSTAKSWSPGSSTAKSWSPGSSTAKSWSPGSSTPSLLFPLPILPLPIPRPSASGATAAEYPRFDAPRTARREAGVTIASRPI